MVYLVQRFSFVIANFSLKVTLLQAELSVYVEDLFICISSIPN